MAYYNSSGKKIRPNALCPCGSGKKFKKCHLESSSKKRQSKPPIPIKEIRKKIAKQEAKFEAFETAHGKGKPIITDEYKNYRFVAVGNRLHFSKKEKTKYFIDFLSNYIKEVLGIEWGNNEIKKPFEDRHQIMKWYDCAAHYMQEHKPSENGIYAIKSIGALLSWHRLAYDLYLIQHNTTLQRKILRRLRNMMQFQGARFELCVTASMITAGFEINYEDETDPSKKHPEFIASHSSGIQIAVEAKSRHRNGVLGFVAPPQHIGQGETTRVTVENILCKALVKEPGKPYFIFVDVNLPASEKDPLGNPWFKEMADTVKKLEAEYSVGSFPANAKAAV